jgi:hypothetical protein
MSYNIRKNDGSAKKRYVIQTALEAFWDKIKKGYPQIDTMNLPSTVKLNFPLLVESTLDSCIKHAQLRKPYADTLLIMGRNTFDMYYYGQKAGNTRYEEHQDYIGSFRAVELRWVHHSGGSAESYTVGTNDNINLSNVVGTYSVDTEGKLHHIQDYKVDPVFWPELLNRFGISN